MHSLPRYAYNKANKRKIPEPNGYELPGWHVVEIGGTCPNATG
jgi:hypothetical protein